MGNKPRKIQTEKEALIEIGKIEDNHCKGCKVKERLRKEKTPTHDIQVYCMNECKYGRKIKAIGGLFEYGAFANNHFKAPNLTKEKYLELKDEQNLSDAEIRKRYDISRNTLARRKRSWKLNTIREYIIPSLVLKDLTKEELEDLARDHSDKEIAEMYGVSKVTILKRRKEYGISKADKTLADRFTKEEYLYLSKKKKLKDYEICDLWEISTSTIFKLKKGWGLKVKEKKPKPEDLGLTREKMLELVPDHTDQEIAEMYDLYTTTITKYRKALGISHTLRKPRFRISPDVLRQKLDKGITKKEIAEELGIHRSTLSELEKYFKEKNLI